MDERGKEPPLGRSQWPYGVVDHASTTTKTRVANFVSSAPHGDLSATESKSGVHGSATVRHKSFQFEDAEEEETDELVDAMNSNAMSLLRIGQQSCSQGGVPILPARNLLDESQYATPAGVSSSISQGFVSVTADNISSVGRRDGKTATTLPLVQHPRTSALAALNQHVDVHSEDSSKKYVTSSCVTTSIHQIPNYESHPTPQPRFMQRRRPDPQTTEGDILPAKLMASRRTLTSRESRVDLQGPLNDIATIESAYDIKDLTTHDVLCSPNMGIFPTAGNKFFERLIRLNQERYRYLKTTTAQQLPVVHHVYRVVTSLTPPGRFKAYHAKAGWIDLAEESAKNFIVTCLSRGITGVTAWMRPIYMQTNVDAHGTGGKRLLKSSTGSAKKRKIQSSEGAVAARNPTPPATQFLSRIPVLTAADPEMTAGKRQHPPPASRHHQTVKTTIDQQKAFLPPPKVIPRMIRAPEVVLHQAPVDDAILLAHSQSDVESVRLHSVGPLDNTTVDQPTQAELQNPATLPVEAHRAERHGLGHDAHQSDVTVSRFRASALASVPAECLLGVPPVQSAPSGASRPLQASDSSS